MLVPLTNTKLINEDGSYLELDFEKLNGEQYVFVISNSTDLHKVLPNLEEGNIYNFFSVFNQKIFRWRGFVFRIDLNNGLLYVNDPVVIDVKEDIRKERIPVKDVASIVNIELDGHTVKLEGRYIPSVTKDISETGILFFTNLDLTHLKDMDSSITLSFEGGVLKSLGEKKVKVQRVFKDGNFYYYGCEFQLNDLNEIKQLNRIIQEVKKAKK